MTTTAPLTRRQRGAQRAAETRKRNKELGIKRVKPESRPKRWADAASRAVEALNELEEMRAEFESWRDNLPDSLVSSALADKLDEVANLDIQSAIDVAESCDGADLPLGFGRD